MLIYKFIQSSSCKKIEIKKCYHVITLEHLENMVLVSRREKTFIKRSCFDN